jgi:Glucoamylase and related glycosyl hydrolases
MTATEPYAPIGDYAFVGNTRTGALISRTGSIDWLCLPRFDSPSVFAAILDSARGGTLSVTPTAPFRVERRYLPETNVLETVFVTETGRVRLRDAMTLAVGEDRLRPEHELLREITGAEGEVTIELCYRPRPHYGRVSAAPIPRGPFGWRSELDGGALTLLSEIDLMPVADGESLSATTSVVAGDRAYLALVYDRDAPAVLPLLGDEAEHRLDRTADWWRAWAGRCAYEGPYRDAVVRSALVLKLLSYSPSGAIIAAPTTSLPEAVGGQANWDYRYCWLRDAAFTVRALYELGYQAEAGAFFGWLLHATRLTQPHLQVVYDVFGESHLPERVLNHLSGYRGSRPVRVGNAAWSQRQLDVYGEVVDAAWHHVTHGGRLDREQRRFLEGIAAVVSDEWRLPDHGIWEERGDARQYTHSKVMCWVAARRLRDLAERGLLDLDSSQLHRLADDIRDEIEGHGYSEQEQSYTRAFGDSHVDAGLLTLPLHDYASAADTRMAATLERIDRELGRGALIFRSSDGVVQTAEAAFGLAGFWRVECLARGGRVEEAHRAMEELLGYATDLGLFAEEVDPATRDQLGNFPQALTHLGLINAAVAIARAEGET